MFHAAIFGAFHAARYAVAGAIGFVAKEGASADDAFCRIGFVGVKAFSGAFWIEVGSVNRKLLVVVVVIKIGAPLPYVAGHIKESVAVWLEGGDGCGLVIFVGHSIVIGKVAIEEIAFGMPVVDGFIPPGIDITF